MQNNNNYQLLSFRLGRETYAIDVMKIREVLDVPPITEMPKSHPFMAGVINLRGGIIPVLDLRVKFGLPKAEVTENTTIIIVEAPYDDEKIMIGILVDSVKKVIKLLEQNVEPPPKFGMSIDSQFIMALGKQDEQIIIILNSDSLFTKEELMDMEQEQSLAGNTQEADA